MRILLVTMADKLPIILEKILNPANEYCAVVVDEPGSAKKFVSDFGMSEELVYPFYDLKECIENLDFDRVLFLSDRRTAWSTLTKQFRAYGLPSAKLINIFCVDDDFHFLLERALRYYREHSKEFDMFATGVCYTANSLDITKFKRKIFNFGHGSQDLYYDYQIAKFVLSGGGNIKYALIGLAPYSFHYDESQGSMENRYLFQYLIAFNDLHNYATSISEVRGLFREEYLNHHLEFEGLDLNDPMEDKKFTTLESMNVPVKLRVRSRTDEWTAREYPNTRKENVQILHDYLALCEKNNVRPILFIVPASEGYMKYFSRKKLDEFYFIVREAMKKYPSAKFFDGWKLFQLSDQHFRDADHVNQELATKFSATFSDFIESQEVVKK